MGTGIFKRNVIGEMEEVPQEHIDYWCSQCQFPYDEEEINGVWVKVKCKSKEAIQRCWDDCGSIGALWHKQHECPFIHQGQHCRCNRFKTIEKAFKSAGLEYHQREIGK